jgi:DNA-binding NtrC family response regulator
LEKAVEERTFRQDLFYRFNVVKIKVPPLRERMEDIPVLAEEIVSRLATDMQLKSVPTLDAATMQALAHYDWPGNVRELRNVLERALIVSGGKHWEILLPASPASRPKAEVAIGRDFRGRTLREVTDEITRTMCLDALEQCNGNKREAARVLGIARDSLYRYLKQFGILARDAD